MGNALLVSQVMLTWIDELSKMGGLLATAHAEGRDLTDAELDGLFGEDDAAKARAKVAIDAAKAAQPVAP